MIISDKPKDKIKFNEDNELKKDDAIIVLTNNMQTIKKLRCIAILHDLFSLFTSTQIKSMRTINPKCANKQSLK